MKKNFLVCFCFAAIAVCAMGIVLRPAFAQTITLQSQLRLIILHNVRPDMMAYWIDPTHQPVPLEYQHSQLFPNPFPEDTTQYVPQIKIAEHSFRGKVVNVDTANALGIFSNQTDFDHDKKVIEALDKPMKQVNIDVRFLYGDPSITKTILPNSPNWQSAADDNVTYKMAVLPEEVNSLTQRLRMTGKVESLNSPRASTLDKYPAELWSMSAAPINVELKTTYPGQILPLQSIDGGRIGLGVRKIVKVLPSVNADGSITMSITIVFAAMLVDFPTELKHPSKSPSNQAILLQEKRGNGLFIKGIYNTPVTFNCTVKEGQSVLIRRNDDNHSSIIIVSAHALPWLMKREASR